ncbi:hypothetical protein HB662_02180 [Roseomonas frigidaquae]|uniref:GpW protein n=1 Tax=Falsiroseomonas frigidaquae TaxID=487318 RepID=A0ABX1EWF2_9PROT|nr:gpW family head-tail joining protein [Falsiroseomonas frigidaquae]NKE43567.1 hypothetical protein [Falsiroseomonas frigidaquae]
MDFSVIDTETLKAWHVEALRALQSLSIGRREVSLSYSTPGSGRSGTYSATNRDELAQWIGLLADALAARGELQQRRPRRRAIGIRF